MVSWRELKAWWRDEVRRKNFIFATENDIWHPDDGSITFGNLVSTTGDPDDDMVINDSNKALLLNLLEKFERATIAGTVLFVFNLELDRAEMTVWAGHGAIRGAANKEV